MDSVFDTWWGIIRDGLHHINPLQGLIIALLFGFTAGSATGVLIGALGASIAYIVVDVLWPVVFYHTTFAMPVMDTPFWHFFLALYFAFLVVIALIYIVRSVISSMRG